MVFGLPKEIKKQEHRVVLLPSGGINSFNAAIRSSSSAAPAWTRVIRMTITSRPVPSS